MSTPTLSITSGKFLGAAPGTTVIVSGNAGVEFDGALASLDGLTIQVGGNGHHFHGFDCGKTGVLDLTGLGGNTLIEYGNFSPTISTPIRGKPFNAKNVTIRFCKVDLRGYVWDGTPDLKGAEWLHLDGICDGLYVTDNVILAKLLRWAMEFQSGMQNVAVLRNYIHATDGGSGISLATGGSATAPFGGSGENIEVGWNVAICDAAPGQSAALEIMGDLGVNVHDNFWSGFWYDALNGTGGLQNRKANYPGNTDIYRVSEIGMDGSPWPIPQFNMSGNRAFKLGDPNAPAPPSMPTNVGAAFDPASNGQGNVDSSTGDTVAQADLIAGITSTTNSLTVTLKVSPVTSGSIQYKSLNGKDAYAIVSIPNGQTVVTIPGQPSWQYTINVTVDGALQTWPAQCQLTGDTTGKAPDGTPATPPPVVTNPVVDNAAILQSVADLRTTLATVNQQINDKLTAIETAVGK